LKVLSRIAKPAAFQGAVRSIPEELSGSIRNCATLAGLELRYDEGSRGIRRLYRLARRNLDDPEAYSAYLINFLVGKIPTLDEAPYS